MSLITLVTTHEGTVLAFESVVDAREYIRVRDYDDTLETVSVFDHDSALAAIAEEREG